VKAFVFLPGLALVLVACGGEKSPNGLTPPDCTVQGPHVAPPSATLHAGDTVRATANESPCLYENDLAPTFRWRSSNTSVAIVDSIAGLVRALDTGRTSIIAIETANPAVQGAMALTVVR
jgi:uncharacterized protein YjdB